MTDRPDLIVMLPNGSTLGYSGRLAWALGLLMKVGERGVTPIDTPGPRWSAYIHELRKDGLDIETLNEPHGGPFPGHHARYILRSPLQIVTDKAA